MFSVFPPRPSRELLHEVNCALVPSAVKGWDEHAGRRLCRIREPLDGSRRRRRPVCVASSVVERCRERARPYDGDLVSSEGQESWSSYRAPHAHFGVGSGLLTPLDAHVSSSEGPPGEPLLRWSSAAALGQSWAFGCAIRGRGGSARSSLNGSGPVVRPTVGVDAVRYLARVVSRGGPSAPRRVVAGPRNGLPGGTCASLSGGQTLSKRADLRAAICPHPRQRSPKPARTISSRTMSGGGRAPTMVDGSRRQSWQFLPYQPSIPPIPEVGCS